MSEGCLWIEKPFEPAEIHANPEVWRFTGALAITGNAKGGKLLVWEQRKESWESQGELALPGG